MRLRNRIRVFLVVISGLVTICLAIFAIEPLSAIPVIEWITPNLVYRIRTDLPMVALSFDDGPSADFTPQVLEILQRHRAKATFFLIGERALRYPELVEQIKADGNEVGNHYFKNGSALLHPSAEFLSYLEQTERAISPSQPKLFRPPGGVAWPWQLRLAQEKGYTCVLGSAYPHDPMHPPTSYITWLVEKNLRPGTIVILHDGIPNPTRSIQVLPEILDAGRRRGLAFVSIGELLKASQKSTR